MPVIDDWNFNYADKVLSHIDGTLAYDTGAGRAPVAGEFIIGNTSGAIGQIISVAGGTPVVSGTLTLTNVIGLFEDNETFEIMSELLFDNVANGGFKAGDTITDQVSGSMDVQFVVFNQQDIGETKVSGQGKAYGTSFTAFTDNSSIDVTGGNSGVALAVGTGTDNDTALTTTQTAGQLVVPGTANTNNSVIIHYDGNGSGIDFPEGATISDTTSGAIGVVQEVRGVTASGSIRLVDSNTTGGAWTDNNGIDIEDVIFFDAQVAGQVFQVGDIIQGGTSTEQARVLAIRDDGDSTGALVTAGKTGAFTLSEDINIVRRGGNLVSPAVKIAEVESTTTTLANGTIDIPDGIIDEQRATDQGGIYPAGSLNIKRNWNELFTLVQDTKDEQAQMDDLIALFANVKDQVYIISNDWAIPDLSMRFLESGGATDTTGDNIWTNYQTDVAAPTINDFGFKVSATNPTPSPDLYIVQNGEVIRQDWVQGNINVVIKTKTNTDATVIDDTVPGLGQNIDNGNVVINARPYPYTYDYAPSSQIGGVAPISLAIFADASNPSGQYRIDYDAGSAATLVVGEEFTTGSGNSIKRGVVVAQTGDAGATGTVDYVLKSGTQLADNEVCTGVVSGKAFTVNEPVTIGDLVAGYDADIRFMITSRRFTGGTTTGTFIIGEEVTDTGTFVGYVTEDDAGTIYVEQQSGTASPTNQLTGTTSGATNTPTGTATFTTSPKDLGEGSGDNNYRGVISADITNANARSVADVYEWSKFTTSREQISYVFKTAGDFTTTIQGRLFRALDAFQPNRSTGDPLGAKPGTVINLARSWFLQKETLISDDIRSFTVVTESNTALSPPNLQSLGFSGLINGFQVEISRSTGSGATTEQRNEFQIGVVGSGNNQSADSTILVAANNRTVSPLPSDVPDIGWLRVLDPNDTENYLIFKYDSVNRSTNVFSLQQGIGQNTIGDVTGAVDLTLSDNVHVVLLSDTATGATLNNTIQYIGDFDYVATYRLKGYVGQRVAGVFGANGSTIAANLVVDPIVNLP